MKEHYVIIYLNEKGPKFTATARKESSSLPAVNEQVKSMGFDKQKIVAKNLSKNDAEKLKKEKIAECKSKGYEYVTRPALN
ncbi:hypothetical protein [Pseudoalteromonas sp. G4]|uniref:hypothetical protein n=1 Tax=Pseudoalteromonas sp. G4 TaxID=2992761 RepID=UPI00237D361D|nr:hypothetical protein [Pseudoalteromonas sp. G4]MDE3270906.1 hypothetical protein [Pseudoalteromonas sp. G4]